MNRQEFAWLVVRALGVISLWNFALALLSLIVLIPSLFYGLHHGPWDSLVSEQSIYQLKISAFARTAGAVFWASLSMYLLYKGKLFHRLLLENIPSA